MRLMKILSGVILIAFIFGCREYKPGGGGSVHNPPAAIEANKPVTLTLKLTTWGAGGTDIEKRYANIRCHYKANSQNIFSVVKMRLVTKKPSEGWYECVIPANVAEPDVHIDYYFDMDLDGHYNRREEKPLTVKPAN